MLHRTTLLFAAAATLAFGAGPAFGQKQTLRMAYWAGPAHHMVKTQEAWIKTIEEASGGNLTVELDKAPLAKPDGQYDLIKNGVRDMVWHVPTYTRGRFDMLAAGEIPFLCPSATVCSPALSRWYRKHKLDEKEFTDTKLLNVFVHGPGMVHSTKLVKTLEEIKGIKIRAAGSGVAIAQALGMSAVALPATEVHEAMSRGTVEGALFPWEAVDSFRLAEVAKAHLELPGGLYTSTFVIVMNNDAFSKLTPANQAALMKVSGDAGSRLFGKYWDEADDRARENAKKRGNTINTLAPAELERWKPMLQFVRDEWLKKAKERGLDGPALLKDLEETIKATSS
jgi:TRAP-type transport system periplasmic protein